MGPQHKRVYARLRRTMRGDDRLKLAASRCGGRAAPPRWTGDAGRYSRSFGLSASLASPPCGEWKAYRVTAAIARNSIQSRLSPPTLGVHPQYITHLPKPQVMPTAPRSTWFCDVPLENFSRWKRQDMRQACRREREACRSGAERSMSGEVSIFLSSTEFAAVAASSIAAAQRETVGASGDR